MKFLVIGPGAWGGAMATHLQRQGHTLGLLARDAAQRDALLGSFAAASIYLPGQPLPVCDAVLVALPSHTFSSVLPSVQVAAPTWISLSKGIILDTLTTPCQTLQSLLPSGTQILSLSGPTHAGTVAQGQPCGMVLSGPGSLNALQEALSGPAMRVYTSTDRLGAELGGALKNAYAVAAGICDGLQLGDNAKAGLLTRALAEMARLGVALGGQHSTFYGLTGVGDLMATSYGSWSRNRQLGEKVAQGQRASDLIAAGLTAEGYRASQGLLSLAERQNIPAPILQHIVGILLHGQDPRTALLALMTRPLKAE